MKSIYEYCYLNASKIDSFSSQLNGYIIEEKKERTQKGVKGVGKLGVKIGSILAMLGLAEATAKGELSSDYSKILEVTTTLSFENKLSLFKMYCDREQQIAEINLSSTDYPNLSQKIASSEFQILTDFFNLYLDKLPIEKAREVLLEALDYEKSKEKVKPKYKSAELLSQTMHADIKQPLVRVPFFLKFLLPNQVFILRTHRNRNLPLSVFAKCIVESKFILANPIAIWTVFLKETQ